MSDTPLHWVIEMFYENIYELVERYNNGSMSKSAFISNYERLVEDKTNFQKEMYCNELY